MLMKLYIGRSGTGKTKAILDEIQQQEQINPLGHPQILITPTQETFQLEQQLTEEDISGSVRTNVYHFGRLAYRVLSDLGVPLHDSLTDQGMTMLIQSIMTKHRHELKFFNDHVKYVGFSEQIKESIDEFNKYMVTPDDLFAMIEALDEHDEYYYYKYHDLALIYEQVEESLKDQFLYKEDILKQLAIHIEDSEYIRTSNIYIDSYHNFTDLEYYIIQLLIQHAQSVTIALTLDLNDKPLFRKTNETFNRLQHIGQTLQVDPLVTTFNKVYRHHQQTLNRIQHILDPTDSIEIENDGAIEVYSASNYEDEVLLAIRHIEKMTTQYGYNYKDIGLLYRDSAYIPYIDRYFTKFEIPYATDVKKTMKNHPLITYVKKLISIIQNPYQYDAVFDMLKTGYLLPKLNHKDSIYRFEQYCLIHHFTFNRWTTEALFKHSNYTTEMLKHMNQLKNAILYQIDPVIEQYRSMKTSNEITIYKLVEWIYDSINHEEVVEHIQQMIQLEQQAGDHFNRFDETQQAYDGLIELLDELTLLDEHSMTVDTFLDILLAGLNSLTFSDIPQTLDEVSIGTMDLAKISNKPIVILIGVNQNVLPSATLDTAIINTKDKEILSSHDINISPSQSVLSLDEKFVFYYAMTRATDKVFVSFAEGNQNNESVGPSFYIQQLIQSINGLKIQSFNIIKEKYLTEYIFTIASAKHYLKDVIQIKGQQSSEQFLKYMSQQHKALYDDVINSFHYINEAIPLSTEQARTLYGESFEASVSRLEMFNGCQFKHYMQYALKAYPVEPIQLDQKQTGLLYHYVMDKMLKELPIETLTKDELKVNVREYISQFIEQNFRMIVQTSKDIHLIQRLEALLIENMKAIQVQLKQSNFKPSLFEAKFGVAEQLKGPSYTVEDQSNINVTLKGQIDRVDMYQDDHDKLHSFVIDYKSSDQSLDYKKLFEGHQMQLTTYLKTVLSQHDDQTIVPIGLAYYHVNSGHKYISTLNELPKTNDLDKSHMKKFRFDGVFVSDAEILKQLDAHLKDEQKGLFIAQSIKKDGTLSQQGRHVPLDFIYKMLEVNDYNIEQAVSNIYHGKTSIHPLKDGQRTVCSMCDFKESCHIDITLKGNRYNKITHSNKTAKEKIEQWGEVDE